RILPNLLRHQNQTSNDLTITGRPQKIALEVRHHRPDHHHTVRAVVIHNLMVPTGPAHSTLSLIAPDLQNRPTVPSTTRDMIPAGFTPPTTQPMKFGPFRISVVSTTILANTPNSHGV